MMVIHLPVKFEFDWTSVFELESGNENKDGQTDGHINGQKIASEMPVPHSLGKYYQHHEI